jgi:hypothetical protein
MRVKTYKLGERERRGPKPFRKEVRGWMAATTIGDAKRGYINTDNLCSEPCGAEVKKPCVGCRQVRIVVESVEEEPCQR